MRALGAAARVASAELAAIVAAVGDARYVLPHHRVASGIGTDASANGTP